MKIKIHWKQFIEKAQKEGFGIMLLMGYFVITVGNWFFYNVMLRRWHGR